MASPRPCHVPFCRGKQQSRDAELDFAMHCKCIEKVLYSIVLIALTHFLNNDYWILTWQCIRIYLTLGIVYDTQTRHQTPRDIVPVLFYLFVCIYYCWFIYFCLVLRKRFWLYLCTILFLLCIHWKWIFKNSSCWVYFFYILHLPSIIPSI